MSKAKLFCTMTLLVVLISSCAHQRPAVKTVSETIVKRKVTYSPESKKYFSELESTFHKSWAKNIKVFDGHGARKKAGIKPGVHYVVKVGYKVASDGSMNSVKILKSSLNKSIDQIALESVLMVKSYEPPREIPLANQTHAQIFVLRSPETIKN